MSNFQVHVDTNNFLRSNLNISLFYTEKFIRQFRKPVNKTEWILHSYPVVVNAYYDSLENSIRMFRKSIEFARFYHNFSRIPCWDSSRHIFQ